MLVKIIHGYPVTLIVHVCIYLLITIKVSCQHGMQHGILKSQEFQVPTTVFVLVIPTQSLIKHQNVINPVGFTKIQYHTITIVIFVTITISILIYYCDTYIELSLLSPSPKGLWVHTHLKGSAMAPCKLPCAVFIDRKIAR